LGLVLVRGRLFILCGIEHHVRRMIDATAIAAEIDAIDYSAVSIRPEFIDANGHLNVGYYTLLFDNALDLSWARLGIYSGLILASGYSSFALETHMTYQRELKLGDPLDFSLLLLDFDAKRIHYFLTCGTGTSAGWRRPATRFPPAST
jgi:acyl-CoA thioester hydrolase